MNTYYTEIIDNAYLEFLLDTSNHPQPPYISFYSALHKNWKQYAKLHFSVIEEYDDKYTINYRNKNTMSQHYKRWFKNSKNRQRKLQNLMQFKDKMNQQFSKFYVNKNNVMDLNIHKHNIGPWFTSVQKFGLSKHMRDKSAKNKGKHLVPKSSVKKKKKKKKKNNKRKYEEMNEETHHMGLLRGKYRVIFGNI
eukprot:518528_1